MTAGPPGPANPFVSRGGLKLRHALDAFHLDIRGLACADLGASTGGFTDCLLQAGASRVVALDTGYGTLAWRLRNDPRVVVRERTNALHATPRGPDETADLVVIDLGWTPQRLALPAALAWLRDRASGRAITLIKPHYEATSTGAASARRGVLPPEEAHRIALATLEAMPTLGFEVLASVQSPIAGGGAKSDANPGRGNLEWLALLRPTPPAPGPSATP